MERTIRFRCFLLLASFLLVIKDYAVAQTPADSTRSDSVILKYPLKDLPFLNLYQKKNLLDLGVPSNINREVIFDPLTRQYMIREKLGSRLYRPPQYLTIDEYQELEGNLLKRSYWRELSDQQLTDYRQDRLIPTIYVQSEAFEKIFGGNTIDIIPRGSADISIMAQHNKNANPMFNERQRRQWGFDFDQRIQMNLTGQIGDRLKLTTNYNTEAQFDFENQIRLDYTGKDDDIIKRIELGNVSMPLNTTLISGTQALFGLKTQLQFGKLNVTGIFSQQRSQQREITIKNGAQESEFALKADEYEDNQHYFLAQYFRENFNRAMALAPILTTDVNITQIEVWVSNRSNSVDDSRDVLALMDLGEFNPYHPAIGNSRSRYPSSGIPGQPGQIPSNDLLEILPEGARLTQSNAIQQLFNGPGANDNYAKLTYARKLREGTEYTVNRRLGFISLNMPLNNDQILAVAYRYTAGGREYQVGEFSTDVPVTPSEPQMLVAKLLKNEILKTNLPIWDLMMKNIYSIGAYGVGEHNFRFNIFRIEDESGVERPAMYEGQNTQNKLWIQLTGLDRLNPQNAQQPDGFFDFLPGITIDPERGRIMFPLVEPFGSDLAGQFLPGAEQVLIDKYTYQALYDSTKVIAQQYFPNQNRYLIKGSYESEVGTEFQLGAINVPRGSVQVFAGPAPLQEGVDFMVDYDIGRVRILNQALLQSGQPIRIKMENNQLFGLQQRTMLGGRLDYLVNDKLQLGGTIMNLTERPLTQKVNIGEEPISNTMWGLDLTYNSPSRWLTRLVDKIPFIDTKEPSSISFYGEFAQLLPGHPRALNFAGTRSGITYVDDFENSRSFIDIKGAFNWQLAGTPQLFPESQLMDDLQYGFNRARFAFYNIDPIFYRNINLTPSNIKGNANELSGHRVREVLEQEVFPYREPATGLPIFLSTLDLAFYPTIRGPYNYTRTGLNPDGTLVNPRSRWGGMFRKIDAPDFEAQNIEFIEVWMMDPFLTNPGSQGGDLYFNLGNISEDILKDGRKAMENGMSPSGDLSQIDETNWGRVPRNQPVIQAFDNDPVARARQDIGLDGLSDADERGFHGDFLSQMQGLLTSTANQELTNDPSGDNFQYFRGPELDNQNAGILKRYERFNGPEGNSKTPEQSVGVETSASTLLPDGEDINRDNNMNEAEEYYQYRISLRPQDMQVGQNYISDMHTAEVELRNGRKEQVKWYQFRIPLAQYQERVGDIRDFKSIRFVRMFMTDFADTAVVRLAQVQLVRGEWRRYNSENNNAKVIADPSMGNVPLDNSTIEVAAVNIEQNGNRQPIPYVVPPGIERQLDWGNLNNNVQLNEQSLSLDVKDLRDGYGRAAYRTATNDFRAYGRLELFIHAEGQYLQDGDFRAFVRVGTDDQFNYYQYDIPLKITQPGTRDAELIWPQENRMNIRIKIFQEAKEARNKALLNGQPWPINVPFTFFDGENRVTILGQPDISKVRFYMLGVMNPLRGSEVSHPGDDGLDKSGLFWFNELRLTDFDDKGGWAVTARMNAQLADFANVTVSGSKSTVGFGSIEQRIGERSRSDDLYFDLVTNAELGKFFPADYGLRIPLFFSYTRQVGTPEYNPLMPDIELNSALANLSRNERDSLLRATQDFTTRRSFNLTNVRKIRTNIDKPVRPWDIENVSATYAYSQHYHRDYLTEIALQKNYRAALDYTFASSDDLIIEPFKKFIKNKHLGILSDFNFNLMPSLLNFRIDVNRIYNENTLRVNNSADNFLPAMGTLYNKNFTMNRLYGISWNLSKSLKLDFNATNYAIVDEPDGRLNGLKRDTLWENFWRLGRTTDYNHMMNITYTLPIHKLPGLDWVNVDARYGTQFSWQTEPLLSMLSQDINMGNSIQNSRTIQLNPTLNMAGLYNKFGFIRNNTGLDASGPAAFFTGLLTSIKNVNAAYTRAQNTFLPGYTPQTNILGYDFDRNAPGWGFLFGSQRDIRQRAAENGWITTDTLQTQLYMTSLTEDLSIRAILEPIRDLSIELTAVKLNNQNYTTSFQFSAANNDFQSFTPVTTGNYSISYLTIGTAFGNHESLFREFERNRQTISQRLGQLNPNSSGQTDNFADGYDRTAQDVVVNAFLAAYRGKDASRIRLGSFPEIPIPNWNVTYSGLNKIPLFSEFLTSLTIRHGYNTRYSINGYNSLIRYTETNGFPSERDVNDNFLPEFQFQQVSIFEQFAPLLGFDARFKNNLTANAEYRRARTLNLSLQNSQLAMLSDQSFVFGAGYRATGFQMPFGWFSNFRMNNDLNFRLDISLNDLKTLVYRSDINESEVSAGNKSISYRPSVDYVINQRFNIRLFFDSNSVRPYTSQTFATSYANFGFNLRLMLQ